ncbi:hypothetical protein EES39_09550 [Streptomyces sp. ADI92-24]|nr:hypothetical protein EES39_09550 [Streptomyces sp. ADI92-24]
MVAEGLPGNEAARIEDGRLRMDRLAAMPDPPGTKEARQAVYALLPRVDYPELIMEVGEATGLWGAFGHVTGTDARAPDLDLTLAAVLVKESTNTA